MKQHKPVCILHSSLQVKRVCGLARSLFPNPVSVSVHGSANTKKEGGQRMECSIAPGCAHCARAPPLPSMAAESII